MTLITPRTTAADAVRRRARPVLLLTVAALVLGILGMHALTTHGASHAPGADTTGATHGAHHATAEPASSVPAVTPGDAGGDGHAGGTALLCAVMLAAAGGAVLLLSALRRSGASWRVPPPVLRTLVRRTTSRLSTGPPPAWEFSVIRC